MGNFLTIGFRVSENREETDLNNSSEDKSEAEDVNMESVNDSGPVEDYVMSEEASSLLNTNQDHSRDGCEEEENGFHVGDFVWVQGVNRHQWWPGKIYDSSDASDLALKKIKKGTLLVAFCRKETFAWCTPSQRRPFIENFREFSKTSESPSFLSAVREAVTEIGQHVENMLVCDEPLVNSVAKNCGIKKGVLVPDVRRETIKSLVLEKPGIVLEDVKSLAKEASFSDLLEVEVLKRKLYAFYRSKGRFCLAKYDDENPYIIGLEDKEDVLKFKNYSCQRPLRKCSGLTRNKKRKHLEESEKKEESGIDMFVDLSTPLASLCKRAKVDDVSSSGESIVQRGKRERKKSKYLSPEYITDFSCSRRKNRKRVMEMEWLKKKLEEMRGLLDETEGGEVTEELKMRLEEESRNLVDKVKKMTVGPPHDGFLYL